MGKEMGGCADACAHQLRVEVGAAPELGRRAESCGGGVADPVPQRRAAERSGRHRTGSGTGQRYARRAVDDPPRVWDAMGDGERVWA